MTKWSVDFIFFLKRPNISQSQAVAVLHLFSVEMLTCWFFCWGMPRAKQQVTEKSPGLSGVTERNWFWTQIPWEPSSVPSLPPSHTTTGKSLHLTKLQLPSCEARIRRALFIQALVWLSCADCKPCGAQTLALPMYVEQLFLNNTKCTTWIHEPQRLKRGTWKYNRASVCSPVLPAAFGCRFNF